MGRRVIQISRARAGSRLRRRAVTVFFRQVDQRGLAAAGMSGDVMREVFRIHGPHELRGILLRVSVRMLVLETASCVDGCLSDLVGETRGPPHDCANSFWRVSSTAAASAAVV